MATIQFSDTSGLTGIVQAVDFELDTDRSSYKIEDLTTNVNFGLDYISAELSEFNGIIQIVEPSIEQFNVTSGTTKSVTLTNDFIKVLSVVVEDSNGDFHELDVIDPELDKQPFDEYTSEQAGLPRNYAQRGNLITFDRKFDYTLSNAVTVRFEPLPSYFESTDTTETANYVRNLSEALVLYASMKWASKNQRERVQDIKSRMDIVIEGYKKMLGSRNRDVKRQLRPNVTNTR